MPNPWDGRDRRKQSTDHDTLIELVQILRSEVEKIDMISSNLKEHEIKDESNFEKIKDDIAGIKRILWIATGMIIALDGLPRIVEVIHTLSK